MTDILFKTDEYIFSYRVAGILIENGKVLLQRIPGEPGFAFPGGHAELGEVNSDTLQREFQEEIATHVKVGELKWVGEIFFPWENKPCHQICLFYQVALDGNTLIPKEGWFPVNDFIKGKSFKLEFHWIPLEEIDNLLIYPDQAKHLLRNLEEGIQHFIYHEN